MMWNYFFHEISPFTVFPDDLQSSLDDDITADVVIIGGGYTGLSTALSLREAGVDVVLLEQDFCGSGASSRNEGHLTPTIGKDLPTLVTLFGKRRAGELVQFADDAVDYAESLMKRSKIDCDYIDTGNIIAGVHPKHEKKMRKAAQVAESVGAAQRFLDSEEMRRRGLPPAFLYGILDSKGGTLNPGKYVAGLRATAIAAGVRVFENSRVVRVEEGPQVVAHTQGGSVRAEKLVLATNAYTGNTAPKIRGLRRKVVPLRVSLFETEPLTQAQLAALNWPNREGVYTSHEILEGYRVTPQNTVVGGSRFVRYRWRWQLAKGDDPKAFNVITRGFRQRLPELAEVKIASYWGGWIGFTLDFLPICGVTGKHQNIYYGLAYAGHGVAQANYMGDMLAALIQRQDHPGVEVLKRWVVPPPPEPLLWSFANGLIGLLRWMDRRTDRQIAADADL